MASVGEFHCLEDSYLGSTKYCVNVSTCQDVERSLTHTCNPIDIRTAEVGHSTVMTNGVHDKCQALMHELMETA